jgi:hypothetical protein
LAIAPEAGLMFMVVRVNQNTQNYSGCRKRICTRLRLHNLGDFMKTISAFIFLYFSRSRRMPNTNAMATRFVGPIVTDTL